MPNQKDYGTVLSVRIPANLHRKAREISKRTGVRLAHVIRQCLEEWVEQNNSQPQDQDKKT